MKPCLRAWDEADLGTPRTYCDEGCQHNVGERMGMMDAYQKESAGRVWGSVEVGGGGARGEVVGKICEQGLVLCRRCVERWCMRF